MAKSTGLALAAGGIALANEAVFAPVATGKGPLWSDINWRIVPATAVLALSLAALEQIAPQFAVGLAGLALMAVVIIPMGKARSPLENVAKAIGV
jgi:hypothetical protein